MDRRRARGDPGVRAYLLWSALFLYHLVDQSGGIRAIAQSLQRVIPDTGWLTLVLAWMLTGLIENVAGFGLPITIGAPMLTALGVSPAIAVASAAIGHSWSVTTSGMALAFRTLTDITATDPAALFPPTAVLGSIAILMTGLATAWILKQMKHWRKVILLAFIVSAVFTVSGLVGLITISSFIAAIVGIFAGILLGKKPANWKPNTEKDKHLLGGVLTYGFLIAVIMAATLVKPVNTYLSQFTWTLAFPKVATNLGHATAAGKGYLFRFLTHPGTFILLTSLFALFVFPRIKGYQIGKAGVALTRMVKSGIPATLGTLFMIGIATLMEHTGMTLRLAEGISQLVGSVYPLFAALVGITGTFITGSNTNSNVVLGIMQKEVAALLKLSPLIILAAQTVGGALGSMIAPAKLAVGTTTSAIKGSEGEILRMTLPIGLGSIAVIGVAAWLLLLF
jgi:lactate permease